MTEPVTGKRLGSTIIIAFLGVSVGLLAGVALWQRQLAIEAYATGHAAGNAAGYSAGFAAGQTTRSAPADKEVTDSPFRAMLERARVKETRNIMHSIENALVQWQTESTDACPHSLSVFVEKKILNRDPKDGWGRPFWFKCPGEHGNEIDLMSFGPDGQQGTADDLKSWETP